MVIEDADAGTLDCGEWKHSGRAGHGGRSGIACRLPRVHALPKEQEGLALPSQRGLGARNLAPQTLGSLIPS